MTHICVSKLTIISSDNGLSPGRCQAIIWTNTGILLIGPLGTNFSEISFEIYAVSIKKMHLKISSWKWQPFCLGLNVLTREPTASPVLTKWWNQELMLATSFGSICPKVTNFCSQNFGNQIWFCTRLIIVKMWCSSCQQQLSTDFRNVTAFKVT